MSKVDPVTSATSTYRMWKRLDGLPAGSRLFSAAAMARVPYFASVLPHVRRMEPGLAEVDVPKWFFVHNHLHTVHAIASCNAAEIAMGMLMAEPSLHSGIGEGLLVRGRHVRHLFRPAQNAHWCASSKPLTSLLPSG